MLEIKNAAEADVLVKQEADIEPQGVWLTQLNATGKRGIMFESLCIIAQLESRVKE
jgi:hypothetical protein